MDQVYYIFVSFNFASNPVEWVLYSHFNDEEPIKWFRVVK